MLIETANECGIHVEFQWEKATLEQVKSEGTLGVISEPFLFKTVEMYNIIRFN